MDESYWGDRQKPAGGVTDLPVTDVRGTFGKRNYGLQLRGVEVEGRRW